MADKTSFPPIRIGGTYAFWCAKDKTWIHLAVEAVGRGVALCRTEAGKRFDVPVVDLTECGQARIVSSRDK